ncbi:MAG: nucleoside triphosphate pyrophosphohydrolase [Anaerolinea sp.]|nr:nucleoside triphosphate pyrophosphohydrolase [Anaerolinea sp.]
MTPPAARITVVGLGPGSAALLTGATRAVLESAATVILRTRHHPTVAELRPLSDRWSDCDDLYQGHAAFADVYVAAVARVFAAAEAGPVVYAVPGHPLVAERSVTLLLESAHDHGHSVQVLPALSFVDVAASALGRDFAHVQLCDALELRIDAQRPALVSQLFDRDATTALKLRLLDIYPSDHRVTVLSKLGTGEQTVREVPLAELDHRPFGFLDSLFVPAIAPLQDLRRFDGIAHVIERLHAPDGCPWDREQTHASLRPHLLEESYEALEAIDSGDAARLAEELGDVLLQVLMHAAVGDREGTFSFGDVTEHIARKLIRRHPHVFGEATASTSDEVYRNWEALKQAEKPRDSILEGVPKTLPGLAASQAIQGRARRIGFDWPDIEGPLDKLVEEVREFARTTNSAEREDEFGDILFVVSNIGQRLGIDAEQALRLANEKFRARFGIMERMAAARGTDLRDMTSDERDALWDAAKAELATR